MLLRETETTVTVLPKLNDSTTSVREDIESKAAANRILISNGSGSRFGSIFEGTYTWEITKPGPDDEPSQQRIVTERIEVPDTLSIGFGITIVLATLWWTFFYNPFAALAILFGCVLFYGGLPFLYPSQILSLDEYQQENTFTSTTIPRLLVTLVGFSWVVTVILYGLPVAITGESLWGIRIELYISLAAFGVFAAGLLAMATDLSSSRLQIVGRLQALPIHAAIITGGYAVFFALAAIPLVIFSVQVFEEIQVSLYPLEPQLPFFTSVFILIAATLYFVIWHLGPNRRYLEQTGLSGLQRDRKTAQEGSGDGFAWRPIKLGLSLVVTLGVSIGVFVALRLYWDQFGNQVFMPIWNLNFYPIGDQPAIAILAVGIFLPVSYFLLGFLYQIVTLIIGTTNLIFKSEFVGTFGEEPGIEVRTVPGSLNYGLSAFSIGFYEFIVVPEPVFEKKGTAELSDAEYTALLEHEKAHLDNGDAKLAFVIKLFSPLIFIGSNVILAFFDFRRRELKADGSVTNQNALLSVLYKESGIVSAKSVLPSESTAESSTPSALSHSLTPHLVPTTPGVAMNGSEESRLTRIFNPYFGNFAMTAAHPSPLERINALEQSIENA